MNVRGADPYILFDKKSGFYYCYTTSNKSKDNKTFYIYKSKDLIHFEFVNLALDLSINNWGKDWFWAPECYCNEKTGLYFMFYSARLKDELVEEYFKDSNYEEACKIGVAVSKSPEGPFVNINDRPLDYSPFDPNYLDIYPLLNEDKNNPSLKYETYLAKSKKGAYISSIDADVFFDEDNRIYLFYSRCCYRNYTFDKQFNKFIEESNILGVELDNRWWNDPLGKTMPSIKKEYFNTNGTSFERKDGFVNIINYNKEPQNRENGNINDFISSNGLKKNRRWSEGSSTFYKYINNKKIYFISYSCNNFENENYGVGIAVSDSPLGDYKKYINNPIISSDKNIPVYSTGHGSFAKLNGKDYYILHGRENQKNFRIIYSLEIEIKNIDDVKVSNLNKGILL